eukprot:3227909-Alexandrium_andersonii.AAC.1
MRVCAGAHVHPLSGSASCPRGESAVMWWQLEHCRSPDCSALTCTSSSSGALIGGSASCPKALLEAVVWA